MDAQSGRLAPPMSGAPDRATLAGLPAEDIAILPAGTSWQVPWELMVSGPFLSCGVVDGRYIRHVTVPAMVASALRRGEGPEAPLVCRDYPQLPVLAARTTLLEAAVLVAETGWQLAVVMDREPRVVTARSVYRALVASDAGVRRPLVTDRA